MEHGLEKEYFSARFQPTPNAVEHQFLIIEKHEAHAEQDEIEIPLLRRLVAFHRLVENPDLVFESAIPDQSAAMA
jgi:hypothetical protein